MIRRMNYRRSSMIVLACVGLWLPGCGDDSGSSETGASSSEGSATMGATDSNPTATATDSASASATDSASASATESGTGADSGTTSEGSATMGATEGATEGDTTEGATSEASTSEGVTCEGLDREACNDNEMCMPIGGRPIVMMGDGVCIGEPEYLECQDAIGCGDAITYGCENKEATIYEFIDTCIPEGWMECPPPPIDLMPC